MKTAIKHARTIPVAVYQLLFFNIILFIGLVIRDLSVLYLLGTLVYLTLLVAILSWTFGFIKVPDEIISLNVKYNVKEFESQIQSWVQYMAIEKMGKGAVNFVITVSILLFRFLFSSILEP